MKSVPKILELVELNNIKAVNESMLGNLKILTYKIELSESEVIKKRKRFMSELAKDPTRYMPMYQLNDWMHLFVFEPIET